jgi:hypothetical protein
MIHDRWANSNTEKSTPIMNEKIELELSIGEIRALNDILSEVAIFKEMFGLIFDIYKGVNILKLRQKLATLLSNLNTRLEKVSYDSKESPPPSLERIDLSEPDCDSGGYVC